MLSTTSLPLLPLASLWGWSELTWGLVLLGIGVALYIIEATNPGFFIAVPGTVFGVAGFLMIVAPGIFDTPWAWFLILAVSVVATLITIQIYRRIAPPEKSNTTIGTHNVVGLPGRAETDITTETGEVTVQGESWRAKTEAGLIPKGSTIRVVGTEGALTVKVQVEEKVV